MQVFGISLPVLAILASIVWSSSDVIAKTGNRIPKTCPSHSPAGCLFSTVHLHVTPLAAVLFACAAAACDGRPRAPESSSWTIRPESGAGPITRQTDESTLIRVFGSANVRRERIQIGEGETVPGNVLFPADSARRLEIIWADTIGRRFPKRLILRGDSSRWSVANGISLGTTLEQLEKLNGRPFTLAGFGWDYGGVVTDWRGGNLATPLGRSVKLYLSPTPAAQSDPVYPLVLGDKDYASDLPAMRKLKPTVRDIFIDFGSAASPPP